MTTIASSALATVQARRFSSRTQRSMRKRGGGGGGHGIGMVGGRASLYKQMYGSGSGNGVRR